MSRFPSAGHLSSWAGLCPSNKQSAGKRLKGPVNRGNVWLRGIMGEVAWAAVKKRDTYFHAQFHRVARRRGRQKAVVAVAHSVLVVIYHVRVPVGPTKSWVRTTSITSTPPASNAITFAASNSSAIPCRSPPSPPRDPRPLESFGGNEL
jgi:Transposase IS116/IS110/IS902 family